MGLMGVCGVGHPGGEREAARADGFCRQQRVVDAAEAQADDEHHGQLQLRRKISGVKARHERHAEAAHAFDQRKIT